MVKSNPGEPYSRISSREAYEMQKNEDVRPISPHLSIYKRLQTAILSILHRITGFGLNIGTILLVLWLIFLAIGESYFEIIYSLSNTLPIKIILF